MLIGRERKKQQIKEGAVFRNGVPIKVFDWPVFAESEAYEELQRNLENWQVLEEKILKGSHRGTRYYFRSLARPGFHFEYEMGNNRSHMVSGALLHHHVFWRSCLESEGGVYRALDLGAGLGFGGKGVAAIVKRDLAREEDSLKVVFSSLTRSSEFEMPQEEERIAWETREGVCAELMPQMNLGEFDCIYCDNVLSLSDYPELFVNNIWQMLRPGGMAILISLEELPRGERVEELIQQSDFGENHTWQTIQIKNSLGRAMRNLPSIEDRAFFLYKPRGIGEELPAFCQDKRFLSSWKNL